MNISSDLIFARDSIVNSSEDNRDYLFSKGPFEDFEDEAFCDPFIEDIDYTSDMGREYLTIVSCAGRIRYGIGPDALFPSDIYAVATHGGWSDDYLACQEISMGGADILPDYTASNLADCLLNILGKTETDFQLEDKIVTRESLWQAYVILKGGPTLMPW